MSSPPTRRIRQLRLTAPDEGSARRGAILLEDAFHTASFPWADGGRILLIRSISVGRFKTNNAPSTIALAIENQLRLQASLAVHAELPGASRHAAVYFHDQAEPYVSLAIRVAADRPVDAWFWPLAARGWRPGMAKDEAMRVLLAGALQTRAGIMAAVTMIQDLREQGALDGLLAALRWQEGPALMRVCGWSESSLPPYLPLLTPATDAEKALAARWDDTLGRWARQWGVEDDRAAWLAAVVLLSEKPSRLLDPRLIARARRLIKVAAGGAHARPRAPMKQDERMHSPATEHSQADKAIRNEGSQPARRGGRPEAGAQAPTAGADAGPASNTIPIASSVAPEHARPEESEAPTPAAYDEGVAEEIRMSSRWPEHPLYTEHAGLFFLLAVMSRMGMAELLEANPDLIELDIPDRLLRHIGRRLKIPANDPAMMILGPVRPVKNPRCDFTAPQVWQQSYCGTGPLIIRRLKTDGRARVLFDRQGRVALAMWRGKAAQGVRELIGGRTLKRDLINVDGEGIDVLVRSWVGEMRRWCRRYARMGLRDLVRRPGRVCATRTHLDVIFDIRRSDIRVRKAGLDLDHGWIPWFSRVVLFHYLYGEEANGG